MEPERSRLRDLVTVSVVCVTCTCPMAPIFAMAYGAVNSTAWESRQFGARSLTVMLVACAVAGFAALVAAIVTGYRAVRATGSGGYATAFDLIVLGLMPLWGLVVNHMLPGQCTRTHCDDTDYSRPFAEPAVFGLLALHAATAVAYAVSRRRPEKLRPLGEALTLAAMCVGVALHLALGVQLGAKFLGIGLVLFPIALPVLAPWLTIALYLWELAARLRRRGAEEVAAARDDLPADVYRHAALAPDAPPPRVSRRWLARALALSPALAGLYAVLAGLATRQAMGAALAFTQTCEHTFSRLPRVVIPTDCHYLCTVAAQGHPWLVRPERLGARNGTSIVVNRQLAVANAFEDLLHARWPRFGRLCRAVYDRVGLPVSRWIRWRVVADAVYLAMKPLEWGFYLALLLLDRGDPERRIERMYRP